MKSIIILLLLLLAVNLNAALDGDSVESRIKFDSLKNLDSPSKDNVFEMLRHQNIVISKIRHTDPNEALFLASEGIQFCIKNKIHDYAATMYNQVGNIFFDQSRFDLSLDAYYNSLKFSKMISDTGAIAYSYTDIGYVYYKQGMYSIAKKYYLESAEWSKHLGISEIYAHSLNSIAWVFSKKGVADSALSYFEKAYKIRLELEVSDRIAHSHSYIGLTYKDLFNDYKTAIDHFEQSIKLFKLDNVWPEGLYYNYIYLGDTYSSMGKVMEAGEYYQLAIKSFRNIKYIQREVFALNTYAAHLIEYDMFDEAIKLSLNGFKKAKKGGFLLEASNASRNLYNAFLKKEDFKEASNYMLEYQILKDSIQNESLMKQSSIIEANILKINHKTETKELKDIGDRRLYFLILIAFLGIAIIVLIFNRYKNEKHYSTKLKTINKRLEHLNDELEKANITKDRFFSIIAHDLKNPVSSLRGTIEILYKEFELFDKNDLVDYLSQLYTQSNSVQDLLENLLTWSRSQSGKIVYDPTNIDLHFMVDNNFDLLLGNAKKKNIILKNKVEQGFEFKADVNMINTVLRNLISNAIKFTPDGGDIKVIAIKGEFGVQVSVKDSGVGMSDKIKNQLFAIDSSISSEGTNQEKGTGLGLIICKEFIDKHNGKIWVESQLGKGSEIIFTIPS